MELLNSPKKFKLHATGATYFGIAIVNLLLTIVTLGFYYPWAKAKSLKYFYGETEFSDSRFQFHGTGNEMFKGFLKMLGILAVLYGIYFAGIFSGIGILILICGLLFMTGLFLIIPVAIHGSLRYRMSRTSWRGIHFGYRGNLTQLFKIFLPGVLLTIITLGIYGSWLDVKLRKYVFQHLRFGNVEADFTGNGSDLFFINLKGFFLSFITFGIYYFWYIKNLVHFYTDNIQLIQNGSPVSVKTYISPGDIFKILISTFLVPLTFGLAWPWIKIYQMQLVLDNMEIEETFNADTIVQTEEQYTDATGEDMLDFLDIDIAF